MEHRPRDPLAELLDDVAGLPGEALAAYRALVGSVSTEPGAIALDLGVEKEAAADALALLEEHGFATRTGGVRAPRYVAVPPSVTLGGLVAARGEALRRAQGELDALEQVYRLAGAAGGAEDVVEIVRGAEAVQHWFARVQAVARREVSTFVRHPVVVTSAAENPVEDELVARGVRYRVLLERAMLDDDPAAFEQLVASAGAGEDVRIVPALPLKLVIVDRELAFLPVLADPDRAAVAAFVVRPSALLDGLCALFEALWSAATPVAVQADGGPAATRPASGPADDVDARLVSLLLAGFTDESAANQLGVSVRTVQRRVRELMDRTGVRTRIQLGWHAARDHWIDVPGPGHGTDA